MNKILLCLFLILINQWKVNCKRLCNNSYYIVGGENCPANNHPFMVSLRRTVGLIHFCGGSLISAKHVLTAAHCVFEYRNRPTYCTIFAGLSCYDPKVPKEKLKQSSQVYRVFIHHKYDDHILNNDIAIVSLWSPFEFTSTVQPVKLPPYDLDHETIPVYENKVCENSLVMGWGDQYAKPSNYKKPHPFYNPYLQCVNLTIITNKLCSKIDGNYVPSTVICAMYAPGGKDSCQADSGGPLLCGGVQYGIVSSGYGCAQPNTPGFYTNVKEFLYFVKAVMENQAFELYSNSANMKSLFFLLIVEISIIILYI